MIRVAVLSLHTSPLVLPGRGDAGGMNVYVRELVSALAQAGAEATVFVRRHDQAPRVIDVEPGFRVVHIDAGPPELSKESLPEVVDDFAAGVRDWLRDHPVDVLHANYWLSGVAGHRLKHEFDLPLVSTFHTLARVKAETGDPEPQRRMAAESEVIACSDVITANSVSEMRQLTRLYGAHPRHLEVVVPGVDPALFSTGSRRGAKRALGAGDAPMLLFVGRIQPLKGVDIAAETLAALSTSHPRARLVVVGGASGVNGHEQLRKLDEIAQARGIQGRISRVAPQPHHLLSTYYRAADVCLVPSRSESFGLVALEAAACGLPVVASDVGGLRTLVDHGRTGYRIAARDPLQYAAAVRAILDDEANARSLARGGVEMAAGYSWTATAARLIKIFENLRERSPLHCTA